MQIQKRSLLKALTALAITATVGLAAGPVLASVPVSITQQGRLLDNGEPMTGTQELEFTIYDGASGGDVLWSDQVSADLGDDGVYTVTLGDSSQPIDSALLQGGEVYLELSAGGETFSPRLEMTSVPFAALSEVANVAHSVADGGVTADALAPGAVTSDAVDSVSWDQLTDVPSGLGDSSDTLGELSCSTGQFARFNGDWDCSDGLIYTAGDGLELSGEEFSLDSDALVQCTGGSCPVANDSHLYFDGDTDGDFSIGVSSSAGNTFLAANADFSVSERLEVSKQLRARENLLVGGRAEISGDILVNANASVNNSKIYFRGDSLGGSDGDPTFVHSASNDTFWLRGADELRLGLDTSSVDDVIDLTVSGRTGARTDEPNAALHVKADRQHRALILEARDSESGWVMGTGDESGNLNFYYDDSMYGSNEDIMARISRDTGEFSEASDERLKRDMERLNGILEGVLNLEPMTYRLKSAGSDGHPTYGFSAQQVQTVFPDLVHHDGDSGYLGLAYGNFGVLAIQAIQEQQDIIDSQTSEIDELRGELESMEERLSRLEAGH